MKVDFWQLSHDPVEKVVALIAQKVMAEGERMLVVSADADQRSRISEALWKTGAESFLANGEAALPGAESQIILLSEDTNPANAASHVVFADGEYRKPDGFDRAFLLFDDSTVQSARGIWKGLESEQAFERSFFRQEGGKWAKVA